MGLGRSIRHTGEKTAFIADALLLAALTLAFCLHYYHSRFIFQGDVFLNLYMHGYPGLFYGGWDPYAWGYTGWYPIFGGLFPLNALMHAVVALAGGAPRVVLIALQANAGVSLFLLSLGMYALFRWLAVGRWGSIAGAVVVMTLGFHVQTGVREFDLFYLHSFMFVPPALICLGEFMRGGTWRWAGLAGVSIGLSLLGGGNVPMFMFLPAFALAGFLVMPWREAIAPRMLLRGALAAGAATIVGIAVGAAMVLPSLINMKYSARDIIIGGQIALKGGPFSPQANLMTLLFRDWWLTWRTDFFYQEYDTFVGVPALVLAAFGLYAALSRRARGGAFMAMLAVGAVLAMYAAYLPQPLFESITFVLKKISIRFTDRYFMVLLVPIGFLAGHGVEWITREGRSRWEFPIAGLALLVAAPLYGGTALALARIPLPGPLREAFLWTQALAAVSVAVVLVLRAAGGRGRLARAGAPVLVGLVFLTGFAARPDHPALTDYNRPLKPAEGAFKAGAPVGRVLDMLYEEPKRKFGPLIAKEEMPVRIMTTSRVRRQDVWAPAAHAYIAFEPYLDPAVSRDFLDHQIIVKNKGNGTVVSDLGNIVFFETRGVVTEKFRATGVQDVYRNPRAFPRYYLARAEMRVPTREALYGVILGSDRDMLREAVVHEDPARNQGIAQWPEGGEESVRLLRYGPLRVEFETHSTYPRVLVFLDLWFPGWKAEVDGEPAEIMKAYGAYRAVRGGAGRHTVVFRFTDPPTFWGRAITGLALALAAGIALRAMRKGRAAG